MSGSPAKESLGMPDSPKRELSSGLLETYMGHFELSKEQVLVQKEAFDLMDLDGNGMVTLEEVKAMNKELEHALPDDELSLQFKELDIDGDGEISFQEFLKVYVLGAFGRNIGIEHVTEDHAVRSQKRVVTDKTLTLAAIEEAAGDCTEMKLSAKKSSGFYVRAATRFLKGGEDLDPVEKLRISALGNAINAACAVAAQLEKDGLGQICKVRTAYPDMEAGNGCAQIVIDVKNLTCD